MKKFFKFIFGLIGILLVLIIVLGVALAISLYNKEEVSPDYADTSLERSTAVVLNTEIEKGLHDASTIEQANITLDEEALEYLFLSITDNIGKDAENALDISGIDVDVIDGKFYLSMSGKFSMYHTLITCGLSF